MDTILEEKYGVKTKQCWPRRQYHQLPRRKLPVVKLGGQDPEHHLRHWKLKKIVRKLRLKVLFKSPIRRLVNIREAYINMMLIWARKMGMGKFGVSKRKSARREMIDVGGQRVDARLVMEIYNRMMANRDQNEHSEDLRL